MCHLPGGWRSQGRGQGQRYREGALHTHHLILTTGWRHLRPNFTAKQALGLSYLPNIKERKHQGSYSELSRLRSPFSKVQQLIVSQSKEVRKQDSGAGEMREKALNFSRWTFRHFVFFPKREESPWHPYRVALSQAAKPHILMSVGRN